MRIPKSSHPAFLHSFNKHLLYSHQRLGEALGQVHKIVTLQPIGVCSSGTLSPIPSPIHKQSGPPWPRPSTWVASGKTNGREHAFLQPCRGQAREQSAGCISAPQCKPFAPGTTCTALCGNAACAMGRHDHTGLSSKRRPNNMFYSRIGTSQPPF